MASLQWVIRSDSSSFRGDVLEMVKQFEKEHPECQVNSITIPNYGGWKIYTTETEHPKRVSKMVEQFYNGTKVSKQIWHPIYKRRDQHD